MADQPGVTGYFQSIIQPPASAAHGRLETGLPEPALPAGIELRDAVAGQCRAAVGAPLLQAAAVSLQGQIQVGAGIRTSGRFSLMSIPLHC